jgi:hypothetical protein
VRSRWRATLVLTVARASSQRAAAQVAGRGGVHARGRERRVGAGGGREGESGVAVHVEPDAVRQRSERGVGAAGEQRGPGAHPERGRRAHVGARAHEALRERAAVHGAAHAGAVGAERVAGAFAPAGQARPEPGARARPARVGVGAYGLGARERAAAGGLHVDGAAAAVGDARRVLSSDAAVERRALAGPAGRAALRVRAALRAARACAAGGDDDGPGRRAGPETGRGRGAGQHVDRLQLVHRQVVVARDVERAVEQRRALAARHTHAVHHQQRLVDGEGRGTAAAQREAHPRARQAARDLGDEAGRPPLQQLAERRRPGEVHRVDDDARDAGPAGWGGRGAF